MDEGPPAEDVALANELLALWDEGRGTSKSQLEIRTWSDSTSHGRHFDRFIRSTLDIETTKRSRQSATIDDLRKQIRGLGRTPIGTTATEWQLHLQHAREACLGALRTWNDPTASFRTGAFSLLFVTAWNSTALALVQRAGGEWRRLADNGDPVVLNGVPQSLTTPELLSLAFPGSEHQPLRLNVQFWCDIRNAAAHRYLPALDISAIPWAQSGLLNLENTLTTEFGEEYGIGERLSVPLQLSGFRDPGVLESRRKLQSALPLDVQAIMSQAESVPAEVLADPRYLLRVAFVPVVPPSGNSPDAVAYFVKPGEVPEDLGEAIQEFVVLAKPTKRPELLPKQIVKDVQDQLGVKFNTNHHAAAARALGAWPPPEEPSRTVNPGYAEYITSFKRWVYTPAWVSLLVQELGDPVRFEEVTGKQPVPCEATAV